jgi:hypothetical protein
MANASSNSSRANEIDLVTNHGDDAPLSISNSSPTSSHKLSRDEMNLAEFPLTVLSKRADPSVKTLEFSDYVKGKNGDVINRQWIITGADKFGLPTSSDDEVLLGLLKLTADDGVQSRKIHFTRYELLRVLRWTTEGRSYTRLQNALDRLSGVRIKATNAFYDNETKLHSTRNFGIIDAYEINDGRDTRPSFFTWSEVLFKSFQVGFIKKLDLDFYLDLQSAVSKRLYRYLDKHFWYRSRIEVNLFTLAHEKIGVSRNYVYASSLRQQLEPALEELKDKGILSEFEFTGKGKTTAVIMVAAHAPKKTISTISEAVGNSATRPTTNDLGNGNDTVSQQARANLSDAARAVQDALISRGLAEKQAFLLTAGQGTSTLERMQGVIAHFDALLEQQSPLISKSPTGFLYRAVQKPFEFTLPGERRNKFVQPELVSSSKPEPTKKVDPEIEYLQARSEELQAVLARTSDQRREQIAKEVEQALSKLRSHISPQRFAEAVQHGVEQRLLEADGFPEFDIWSQKRSHSVAFDNKLKLGSKV